MRHWDIEVNGKTVKVKGKEIKNGLFLAFKNHFPDMLGDKELTIKVTPVIKEEKPAKKKEKGKKEKS